MIGDGGKRGGTRPEAILDELRDPRKIKEGVDSQGRPFKVYQGEILKGQRWSDYVLRGLEFW